MNRFSKAMDPLSAMASSGRLKILFLANTDWYLYNFRRSLAETLRRDGCDVVLVSPAGEYGKRLQNLGFRWIPFNFSTRSMNPMGELKTVLRLLRLYINERPTIAHHFTIKCVLYGSIAARLTGGVRIVNSVTGLGYLFSSSDRAAGWALPVASGIYRHVLGVNRQRVIFQNEEDQETFIRSGLIEARFCRLIRGSGVDCERFKPAAGAQERAKQVRVLFASRLLREKGVDEFIAAARLIKSRGGDAEFFLAGDVYEGNPSSLSKAEVEAIHREGVVRHLGHVEKMWELLAGIDIVVLPSYREGTPRILLEAAASGKAIVATDIAGCRGLIHHGVNGLLVPVKDPGALAAAIEELINHPEKRIHFGRAGREIVLREFDERIVIRKTLDVYCELLEGSRGRSVKSPFFRAGSEPPAAGRPIPFDSVL